MKTLKILNFRTERVGGGTPVGGASFNPSESSELATLSKRVGKFIDEKYPPVTKNETLHTQAHADEQMKARETQVGGTGQETAKLQALQKGLENE